MRRGYHHTGCNYQNRRRRRSNEQVQRSALCHGDWFRPGCWYPGLYYLGVINQSGVECDSWLNPPQNAKPRSALGSPPPVSAKLNWCWISRSRKCWRGTAPPGAWSRSYEMVRYIALLIRQDDARVRGRIKSISRKRCGKCGERVPVNSCPCNGDSQCWVTKGWHETKLIV